MPTAKKAVPKKTAAKKTTTAKKAVPKKIVSKKAEPKKTAMPVKAGANAQSESKGAKETRKAVASGKQKIRVIIRAFDHKIADESARIIIETAERTGAIVAGPIPMPTKIEKFTINRSTFINKDSREQLEIRTHKRLIDIMESTQNTIGSLSNLNLPAGVDVEIKMIGA